MGSARRLADRLDVTEKSVNDWLKKSEEDLRRLRHDHLDAIERVAIELGLPIDQFRPTVPLWNIRAPFDENMSAPMPAAPNPKTPFRNQRVHLLGTIVNSPIVIGASDFTNTSERAGYFLHSGADMVVLRTRCSEASPPRWPVQTFFCAPGQSVLSEPLLGTPEIRVTDSADPADARNGVVASFRWTSPPPSVWQECLRETTQRALAGQLVVQSVVGVRKNGESIERYIEDWIRVIELAAAGGASTVELDFSNSPCPELNAAPFRDPILAKRILRAASHIKVTKLVKIGHVVGDQLRILLDAIVSGGLIQGVSAINCPEVRAYYQYADGTRFNLDGARVYLAGHLILPLAQQCITEIANLRAKSGYKDLSLIGGGGIGTQADFESLMECGADAVQVASAFYFRSDFHYNLRLALDAKGEKQATTAELDLEIAIANFTKAGLEIAKDHPDKAGWANKAISAAQAQTAHWIHRRNEVASLGPMRPARAPTLKECIDQVRKRLNAELAELK
jgi:dihydroorotate dehydrogenase